MSKRKYSLVWLYFEEEEGKKARCKFCKATLSFSGGCNGNLNRHLKLKHSFTSSHLERQGPTTEEIIKYEPYEEPSTSTQVTTITPGQQTTQYLGETPVAEEIDVDQIDKQILRMIAKGHHSYQLVEEPDFIKLINEVSNCSGYTLPSRNTLKSSMRSIHTELLEDIKAKIQTATEVCLTLDIWTSQIKANYITVTAHYINHDTKFTSHLLECEDFESTYTLYTFLRNVISNFQINYKITAIVSDLAPSVVAAIRQLECIRIDCFAHALQSMIQAATAEIAKTTNKVRKIFENFCKSPNDLNKLLANQKHMNLPEIKIKTDDPTRWNSTFQMLQTIDQIQDAINITSTKSSNIALSSEDWEIIEETVSLLQPFNEVITEMSEEKHITLSKVAVICQILEDYLSKCSTINKKVTKMATNLQTSFASSFGNLEKEYLYAESIILDPRFKRRGFKSDATYEDALKILRNKLCTVRLPIDEEENPTAKKDIEIKGMSIWEKFDKEYNERIKLDNNAACNRELDKYLNEENIDRKEDPLVWWGVRKRIYPRVYLYAVKRLSIVGTCVPAERIFSKYGQVLNERRSILNPNQVKELVFLHSNM